MISSLVRSLALTGVLLFSVSGSAHAVTSEDLTAALSERIQQDDGLWAEAGDERLLALIESYDGMGYQPIWVNETGPNDKARALIDVFRAADEHGLYPPDYSPELLAFALEADSAEQLADLEVALSRTLLEYAHHVRAGRVTPSAVNNELKIYPVGPDPRVILSGARTATDISNFVDTLPPKTSRYERLKAAFKAYRDMADKGGWTEVPAPLTGKSLKPDMVDPMVAQLAERLVQSGDLKAGAYDAAVAENTYTEPLIEGVKAFQARHGLELDGVVGPNTLAQINTSIDERIRQITINLERRRWMPESFGETYIFVNLADQFLKVVREDGGRERTIHEARTVVGKTYHRTPVFSEDMTYLVLNPNWNVPYSIATKEYLPKLRSDPGVLTRQNIRVLSGGQQVNPWAVNWSAYSRGNFPFRLQQAPGKRNALGQVKFMFPNEHNVYIHDTPSKSLFSRASRAFSHGCVRVENPLDLAEVLLKAQGRDRDWINGAVNSGKRRVVKLDKPVPVHITYLTAWVNKDGTVNFRRDIYDRDPPLAKALERVEVAGN